MATALITETIVGNQPPGGATPSNDPQGASTATAENPQAQQPTQAQTQQPATPPTQESSSKKDEDSLGEAGKRALDREREAREEAEKELKALKAKEAARVEQEAKERGDWQKLAEAKIKELEDLKAEMEKQGLETLRIKVAAAHKLPDEIADRLVGTTEAELVEDAKRMAKFLKPPAAPETEAGVNNRRPPARPAAPSTQGQEGAKPVMSAVDGTQKVAWPDS